MNDGKGNVILKLLYVYKHLVFGKNCSKSVEIPEQLTLQKFQVSTLSLPEPFSNSLKQFPVGQKKILKVNRS